MYFKRKFSKSCIFHFFENSWLFVETRVNLPTKSVPIFSDFVNRIRTNSIERRCENRSKSAKIAPSRLLMPIVIVLRTESRSTLIFDREFSRGSKFFHPIIESVHVNTQDLKKLIPESGGILRRSLKFGISYKQRLSRSFYLPMLYNMIKISDFIPDEQLCFWVLTLEFCIEHPALYLNHSISRTASHTTKLNPQPISYLAHFWLPQTFVFCDF